MKLLLKWINNVVAFALVSLLFLCCSPNKTNYEPGVEAITGVVNSMTELMVNDVTNPPLAARFFAYTMLAGYEVVSKNDSSVQSFIGKLNNYPVIPKPTIKNYSWRLAAICAMLQTASALQPSGKLLQVKLKAVTDSCYQKGMTQKMIDSSTAYATIISTAILAYAKTDGYRNISNFIRYTPQQKEGFWYPTPPGFFSAVEPYFNRVRSFSFDSAAQFKPLPPVQYNSNKTAAFYKLTKAVYAAHDSLTEEQKIMAAFWDCNPFALEDEGHLKIGVKKISPGAHWIGITGIVCKAKGVSFSKALLVHTVLGITLLDAFLSCWDEKYRSNRIRPESAIRKFIDPGWKPFLQTPPFPEYPSGHSVISGAAAEILTHYFGDDVAFTDTTEVAYGAGTRQFKSFRLAANEAALSRFYGGIHFMDAIDNGLVEGRKIGVHVIEKVAIL